MNEDKQYIKLTDLAEELDLTRQVLNYHIDLNRAGPVEKTGDGLTHEWLLTVENVVTLLKWLRGAGRGNKRKLVAVYRKYQDLLEN